jgi:hypothetical protein
MNSGYLGEVLYELIQRLSNLIFENKYDLMHVVIEKNLSPSTLFGWFIPISLQLTSTL